MCGCYWVCDIPESDLDVNVGVGSDYHFPERILGEPAENVAGSQGMYVRELPRSTIDYWRNNLSRSVTDYLPIDINLLNTRHIYLHCIQLRRAQRLESERRTVERMRQNADFQEAIQRSIREIQLAESRNNDIFNRYSNV